MIKKKDGFRGERSVILPPMTINMEENDTSVSSLYITDIGHYPLAEHHHRNRPEAINQYVLIYCVDGSGWYSLKGKKYQVRKNQYFILPAGYPHEYGATDGDEWSIYWVHFQGAHASVYAEGAQEPQEVRIAINSRINERNNIFEEILSTLHFGNDIEDLRYASSLLHYYLASLRYLRQYRNTARFLDDDHSQTLPNDSKRINVIEAAIHYMQENIEHPIYLQDILHYVGYSSTRFSTLFKRQTGYSPISYFNYLKMKYACHMLTTTDLHINQICYKVGLEDSLYFSRLFSKIIGMSPSEYRKKKENLQKPNK